MREGHIKETHKKKGHLSEVVFFFFFEIFMLALNV